MKQATKIEYVDGRIDVLSDVPVREVVKWLEEDPRVTILVIRDMAIPLSAIRRIGPASTVVVEKREA